MLERRQVQRTLVRKPAKIVVLSSLYDCTARNLTALGACLELHGPIQITGSFDLTFDSARTIRQCRVIWSRQDRIGVAWRKKT
jgi:hypothetical protein